MKIFRKGKTDYYKYRIADFYRRWFWRSFWLFVLAQIFLVAVVCWIGCDFCALFSGKNLWLAFVLTSIIFVFLEVVLIWFYLKKILLPVDAITRELSRISGENSSLAPFQINDKKITKNGIRGILLAIKQTDQKTSDPIDSQAKKNDLEDEILRRLPVGFIVLDSKNQVIAANELAPQIYYKNDQANIELDFSNSDISLWKWAEKMRESAISGEKIWNGIANKPRGEDNRRIFDVLAHYTQSSADGFEIMIITIDRTEFYESDENRDDFLMLMAHELRAPLTVIRGYLDILRADLGQDIAQPKQEILGRLQVSSQRLAAYINNILNMSRFDQKHLKLRLVEMRPIDLVGQVVQDMELRASAMQRKIIFKIPENLPTVAADSSSIAEVLSNLIDNAIKYSPKHETVEVFAKRDGDFVRFFVRDHGAGIPANVLNYLFSKFYRSYRSRENVSGSGLGLYISRAIVESHGGQIGVDSEENVGSTFNFTLPIFSKIRKFIDLNENNIAIIAEGQPEIKNHSSLK